MPRLRDFQASFVAPPLSAGDAANRVEAWRLKRLEENRGKRNRKTVDNFIRRIGKKSGGNLSLNNDGVCCFPCRKFVIVVEVPEFDTSVVRFRAKVCHIDPTVRREEIICAAMAMSCEDTTEMSIRFCRTAHETSSAVVGVQMEESRQHATLDIHGDSANLVFSAPVLPLCFNDMVGYLDSFLSTALAVNKSLEVAKVYT